jgi:nucleoside 2-deoxyribosyltransferase
MKVYLASSLTRQPHNTQEIHHAVTNELGLSVFLPHSLNRATSMSDMERIGNECFAEIEKREILIAICPFGLSVAAELGYAIAQKKAGMLKHIILYQTEIQDCTIRDATLAPFIDFRVNSINELLLVLRRLGTINGSAKYSNGMKQSPPTTSLC